MKRCFNIEKYIGYNFRIRKDFSWNVENTLFSECLDRDSILIKLNPGLGDITGIIFAKNFDHAEFWVSELINNPLNNEAAFISYTENELRSNRRRNFNYLNVLRMSAYTINSEWFFLKIWMYYIMK